MLKELRIAYADFWDGFDPLDNFFQKILSTRYTLILSDNPDVLFFSVAGNENKKFNRCVKIFFSGENVRPDFSLCDYAISSDFIDSDRYYRWPLYNLYGIDIPEIDNSKRTKFCCMVVSNDRCTYRNLFFERLSKINHVDSGGKYKNNVGGPVNDKNEFLKEYKFTLAFENSSYPGYTTEKILQAKKAGCIPIYWGNPLVAKDFNPESFINIQDFSNWKDAISYICQVNDNPVLFNRYQQAPLFINKTYINVTELIEWLVKRIPIKTDRYPITIVTPKPSFDIKWFFRYLTSDFINIITRKTGLKRALRNIIYKAY